MTFETLMLIGFGSMGLTAYTWFVVELAWTVVFRRIDREIREVMLEHVIEPVGDSCACYPEGNLKNCPAPGCHHLQN